MNVLPEKFPQFLKLGGGGGLPPPPSLYAYVCGTQGEKQSTKQYTTRKQYLKNKESVKSVVSANQYARKKLLNGIPGENRV